VTATKFSYPNEIHGIASFIGEVIVVARFTFLLRVRALIKLFRRLFLARLLELHANGRLHSNGDHVRLI